MITTRALTVRHYGRLVLDQVAFVAPSTKVTALIGPTACGKTTLLQCLHRMAETLQGCAVTGSIDLDGEDLLATEDVASVRRRVGYVGARPHPFPTSVFENVAFGPRVAGFPDVDARVERALRRAHLWEALRDRLDAPASSLALADQQRLAVARTLACQPSVLLLDEPTRELDPITTGHFEELLRDLAGSLTVVIVTHSLHQAARVSDHTAFFDAGRLIESGPTRELFRRPRETKTEDYLSQRFGPG